MKRLVLAACVLSLSACSWFEGDSDEAVLEPAELVDFNEEVELDRIWSRGIGSSIEAYQASLHPVASTDTVFAADHEGQITAIALQSGDELWQVELDVPVSGGVGYAEGSVLVGTLEGEVFSLNAANGEVQWQAGVSSEVLSAPASDGSVVVVQTIDNKVYALDAATGEQKWRHDADSPILTLRGSSSPVITGSQVVIGFDSGKLGSFSLDSGALVWEARLALPQGRTELERMVDIDGAPLLIGDVLYATSYQGRAGALSRGTGRSLWVQDSSSHSSPAYGMERLYVSEQNDHVRAYRAGSGQVVWTNEQLFLRRLTGPVVVDGLVAVADADGYVHLLDQADGHFVGREKVDGSGVSTPMLAVGDLLVVQANDGSVAAYRIQR